MPLPFSVYFWTLVAFFFIGLFDSIYLAISHYRVHVDIGYSSFCAVSRSINCDTVSQSPYAIFLQLPVSVWGVIGYLFFFLLIPLAMDKSAVKKRLWAFFFLISFFFCICSIILALISTYYIHSYCIMCVLSYAVNFFLLFYSWIIRKRFSPEETFFESLKRDFFFLMREKRKKTLWLFIPFILVVALTWHVYPKYWNLRPPLLSKQIARGITKDLHPWIGAENPELVIREFSDYQCFQCKKMHFYLRQLIAEHPDKIRLVHHQYPMDSRFNPIVKKPFHEGSGKLALIAIHGMRKNKFWEVNDVLFNIDIKNRGGINSKDFKNITGLDNKELFFVLTSLNNRSNDYINNLYLILQRDIREGMKAGVTGTPGYLVNKKLYLGIIPPDVLKDALE